MDSMISGVKVKLYHDAKSNAFGRRKKPKKTDVFMRLTKDEEELTWGPKGQKKGHVTYPVDILTVKYGKESELFSSGIKDAPWECFTIVADTDDGVIEYDFVSSVPKTVMTAVTVVDMVGGAAEDAPRMTRGRFLWKRMAMRIDYDNNKLRHIINAGVHNDDEDDN